jgi:hypothetical protein
MAEKRVGAACPGFRFEADESDKIECCHSWRVGLFHGKVDEVYGAYRVFLGEVGNAQSAQLLARAPARAMSSSPI